MTRYYLAAIDMVLPHVFIWVGVIALLRKEGIDRAKSFVRSGLYLGFAAALLSCILRFIPHLINRTHYTFHATWVHELSIVIFLLCFLYPKVHKFFPLAVSLVLITGIHLTGPFLALVGEFAGYGQSFWTTEVLFRFLGWLLGITFVSFVFWGFLLMSRQLTKKQISRMLYLAIATQAIVNLTIVLQRLYSIGSIPRNPNLFKFIAFVINNATYFVYAELAIFFFLPLSYIGELKLQDKLAENPAALRKAKASHRSKRRRIVFLVSLVLLAFLSLSVLKMIYEKQEELSPPEDYEQSETAVLIPLKLLDDMHLHRFEYVTKDGIKTRFIALQKSKGAYAVAMDACEICGPSGYFERGDDVVCKLCDVVMNRGTIGFPGGCNPIPAEFEISGDHIELTFEEIEKHADVFR